MAAETMPNPGPGTCRGPIRIPSTEARATSLLPGWPTAEALVAPMVTSQTACKDEGTKLICQFGLRDLTNFTIMFLHSHATEGTS